MSVCRSCFLFIFAISRMVLEPFPLLVLVLQQVCVSVWGDEQIRGDRLFAFTSDWLAMAEFSQPRKKSRFERLGPDSAPRSRFRRRCRLGRLLSSLQKRETACHHQKPAEIRGLGKSCFVGVFAAVAGSDSD